MPITKYKLISVITDSFQQALWADMRFYMIRIGINTDTDNHVSPTGIWATCVDFKFEAV